MGRAMFGQPAASGGSTEQASAIETLYIPRVSAAPETRPGRTWRANFANQELTAALFDITTDAGTWTYGTDASDGNRAVILPPSPYPAIGKILAKNCMARNVEVATRFRVPQDAHVSTVVQTVMRYLSGNNMMYAYKSFQPATPFVNVDNKLNGGTGNIAASAATTVDVTTSKIYKLKSKCVENCVWVKCWIDGTVEPDWQAVSYVTTGAARAELGTAGLWVQNVGGVLNVSELTVTELLPASDNVVFNGDFSIMGVGTKADAGTVLGWPITPPTGNSVSQFTNVVDASGSTRRFFYMRRPTLADGQLGGLIQNIYRRDQLLGVSISGAQMDFTDAKKLEVGVTSKSNNLRHGAGGTFLGLAVDCYWYDETTTVSNVTVPYNSAGYYKVLGPNRASPDGTPVGNALDGTGTWGWRRDYVRIDVSGNGAQIPNRIDFLITMHDNDLLVDDLWIGDFYARPVF